MSVSFLGVELGIRAIGTTDADGQFYFNERPLRPYAFPLGDLKTYIEEIKDQQADDNLHWLPDDQLGWIPSPSLIWEDDYAIEYRHNRIGIRADREFEKLPDEDVIRIALFGDSFTYGADTALEDSWAYHMEQILVSQGLNVEVMNFGVGGYGLDQSYLRWQLAGQEYQPDIVVLGYIKDLSRNANMFRGLLRASRLEGNKLGGIVYSKPRFIQSDDGLKLINSPTVSLDGLYDAYANLDSNPLREYDVYYDSEQSNPLLVSKFLSLLLDTVITDQDTIRNQHLEAHQSLAIDIVDMFANDVKRAGSQFVVMYMPTQEDARGEEPDSPRLYQHLTEAYAMVDMSDRMPIEKQYYDRHYLPPIGEIIGEAMAEYIVECLEDTCQPIRLK